MNFQKKLRKHLQIQKMKIYKNFIFSVLFLLVAMAIVGFKVLYPYQFILSLPFLVLAIRFAISLLAFSKNKITHTSHYHRAKKFFLKYEKVGILILFLGVVVYIFTHVLPNDAHPFEHLSDAEIETYVNDSLDISVLHMDRLEITGNELLSTDLLNNTTLTADELGVLGAKWNEFLDAVRDSEEITDVHRYFGQISYFKMPETHAKSFTISYALYLKKYEMFGRIINVIGTNERIIKALNEYSSVFEGKNAYDHIRERYVDKDTFLRRNFGRAYAWFNEKTIDTEDFGEDYNALNREGKESYTYIITNIIATAGILAHTYQDEVEGELFKGWFPIQMNVADAMGKVHVSMRHTNFITREQVHTMKESLHPGDILIERRNWHLSNVGIPGFWPHAALYLGTFDEINTYFLDQFPRDGYNNFIELIRDRNPIFYATYVSADENGDPYAVIEGQAPGIILQSLEKSAMADYVGVLRPRISKADTLNAVIRAIGNFGKPYDYNFDFETRDEIVCSELVYDAYLPHNGSSGVNFELTLTSGRKMISPNSMVEKFYTEHGTTKQELDFVYFLDGNESLEKAFRKDENAFLTSWTRSKFSHLQE
jgi:hypothetical protein